MVAGDHWTELDHGLAFSSLSPRYVSHMTGTSTAIGLRLEGFHHDKHEDDILIQAIPWPGKAPMEVTKCIRTMSSGKYQMWPKFFHGFFCMANWPATLRGFFRWFFAFFCLDSIGGGHSIDSNGGMLTKHQSNSWNTAKVSRRLIYSSFW